MTEGERKVLDFVRDRIEATGLAPTVQEIQQHLGLRSKSAVFQRISGLVRQGLLERQRSRSRGLALPGVPDLAMVSTTAIYAELSRRGECPSEPALGHLDLEKQ